MRSGRSSWQRVVRRGVVSALVGAVLGVGCRGAVPLAPTPAEAPPLRRAADRLAALRTRIEELRRDLDRRGAPGSMVARLDERAGAIRALEGAARAVADGAPTGVIALQLLAFLDRGGEGLADPGEFRVEVGGGGKLSTDGALAVLGIREAFDRGDYPGATTRCEAFPRLRPDESLPPEIEAECAYAFAGVGREEEATRRAFGLVQSPLGDLNLLKLRFDLGDWFVSLGRWGEAERMYQSVLAQAAGRADWAFRATKRLAMVGSAEGRRLAEMRAKLAEAQDLLDRGGGLGRAESLCREVQGNAPPGTTASVEAADLLGKIRDRIRKAIEERGREALARVEGGDVEGGRGVVASLRGEFTSAEEAVQVDQVSRGVEEAVRQRRTVLQAAAGEEGKRGLARARRLLDAGRFAEAVSAYASLLGTPLESEALKGQSEAIDALAARNRKRASELFVKARSASGKERRRLLREVYFLLEETLQRYPTSTHAGKIRSNLDLVRREGLKEDPHLFDRAEPEAPAPRR